MLLIYKGKGILLLPILFACQAVVAFLIGVLCRNVPLIRGNEPPLILSLGLGFFISASWIWWIKDTYYLNKEGKKVVLQDEINSFFFIKLNYWSHIFTIAGIVCIVETVF